MENVMPLLLPLVLRDNGASNKAVGFIVTGLYMIVNAIANPIISYKSDRYRCRWGRRRPFILLTTPFVVLLLALIPFAPAITQRLESVGWIAAFMKNSPITTLVLVSGLLVALFQVFNMFVSSVYYYLVVDVVPEAFIARFYGLLYIFCNLGAFVFNYFIFGMAKTYLHEIFIGTSLIYGFIITLMCLKVKEGEYPPPNKKEAAGHWWSGIHNYTVQCFGKPFFLIIFVVYSIRIWANASDVFLVFLYRDQMGLTLDQIGKITAFAQIFSVLFVYPAGILVDRLGSHKSLIIAMALYCVVKLVAFFLVDGYWSLLICNILWLIPYCLITISVGKWIVDLYPNKQYGQFASAGAMISSIGAAVFTLLCGQLIDFVQNYRYALLWPVAFHLIGIWGGVILYRKWKAMGGKEGYQLQCESLL
jgi:MFS family permease